MFEEQSERSGLGFASLPYTGFGTAWLDVDNDGRLEILTVNGAVHTVEALSRANDPFPLREGKLLFRSLGGGRFEDVTMRAGPAFQTLDVSRGAAFGDVDNDGDVDVLVANNNGKARLLINEVGARNHWVGLRLAGKAGRDMLGARVAIFRDDGSALWRRARADGSYASANDPTSPRRARSVVEAGPGARHLARRRDGGVGERPGRSIHDADGRIRKVSCRGLETTRHGPAAG